MFYLETSGAPFRILRVKIPGIPASAMGAPRWARGVACPPRAHPRLRPHGCLLVHVPCGSPVTPCSPSWSVRSKGEASQGARVGAQGLRNKLTPAPPVPVVRWGCEPRREDSIPMNQLEQPRGEQAPCGRGPGRGGKSAGGPERARGLVIFQEPLWNVELLSLPALVPASNFSSWNLSFPILKMGIMQALRQGWLRGFNGIRCRGLEWDPGPGRGCLLSWETGAGRGSLSVPDTPSPALYPPHFLSSLGVLEWHFEVSRAGSLWLGVTSCCMCEPA